MSRNKSGYLTLGEAVQFLGERLESVRARVDRKEIPVTDIDGQQMIRRLALNDFYHDQLLPQRERERRRNGRETNNKKQAGRKGSSSTSGGAGPYPQRVSDLENQVKQLRDKLKTQNERWQSWLEQERTEHEKNNLDAQAEISNLDKKVETLKSELEHERQKTDKEHADRLGAQREVQELKAELEDVRKGDNPLRSLQEWLFGEESSDEKNQVPSLETEKQLEAIQSELENEKQRREESEDWVKDLQSELESLQSELEKEQVQRESSEAYLQTAKTEHEEYVQRLLNSKEQAIAELREKASRYENEKNLLDEIRRVLGSQPAGVDDGAPDTIEGVNTEETDNDPEGYLLDTPDGQRRFLPPFELEEGDLELLRLVAEHGELTADQIRRQTEDRRAPGKLNELLDELEEEGVTFIEVLEDRYRLDVTKL